MSPDILLFISDQHAPQYQGGRADAGGYTQLGSAAGTGHRV